MSDYEILLDEIVERLAGTKEEPKNLGTVGVEVTKLKEFNGQYTELKNSAVGRIVVGFWQDRFGTELNPSKRLTGAAVMDRDTYLTVTVASKLKYGERGVLYFLQIAMRLLQGFRPSTGGELYAFGAEIKDFKNNAWYFQFVVKAELYLIPMDNFREEKPLAPGKITDVDFVADMQSRALVDNRGNKIVIPSDTGNHTLIEFE